MRNLSGSFRCSRWKNRFVACWVTQAPVGVGRAAGDVHLASGRFDEEQHIGHPSPQAVDGEEVDREEACGLLAKELCPARADPAWAGSIPARLRMPLTVVGEGIGRAP
jgi:hypothetical protein